jgi:chemotaxis protein CheD
MNVRTTTPLRVGQKINVMQGEYYVDNNPHTVLTTILGSCVAACIWDSVIGVGGMNHFLLPGDGRSHQAGGDARRFGVHAMELLLNALLHRGAIKSRMRAKLFGGAKMIKGLADIGELNAHFGEQFLREEGIALVGGSLRGDQGRRIQFWPHSGRARQVFFSSKMMSSLSTEPKPTELSLGAGDFELF